MTEFQHEDATSTALALREVDGKLSQMSEEQGNESGLWWTRYVLEDELKLHEDSESDGQRLTPTQVRVLDALMNGASQAEAAEAAGKSARWLWTQLNEGGSFSLSTDRQCSRCDSNLSSPHCSGRATSWTWSPALPTANTRTA